MKNSQLLKCLFLLSVALLNQHVYAQAGKGAKAPATKAPSSPALNQQKFSVYFDVNQAKIKPADYKTLDSVVLMLGSNTNVRRVQINGYADTTGGAEANLELSNRRTDTVANYILGKNLMQYKNKITTAFFGEKVSGKESDIAEMRRVDIVIFMAKPDRDTTIRIGCLTAIIKANTFEGFNNDELQFKLDYIGTAADMKKANMPLKDENGNTLLSNGVVKLSATFKGKSVKAIQAVTIRIPKINDYTGYSALKGAEDKQKNITWKTSDGVVTDGGKIQGEKGENCDVLNIQTKDLNQYINCATKNPACNCTADPFGGLQTPDNTDPYAKFGSDKTIVILNDGCFKKLDATKAFFNMEDGLYPDTYLDFCTSMMFPGVGDVPQIPKFERDVIKFIDFNVSAKNDSADLLMVKKTKVLILIPKSKFPAHEGKQYAILPAETKKDNFWDWTTKPVFNDACQGLTNCDYWVFEAPFTGFYTLIELTPQERNNSKNKNSDEATDSDAPKSFVKIKSKKFNNVKVYYGTRDGNKVSTSKFVKNKGKNSINEPSITKKEKKEHKEDIFLAYVVKDGKRYAWIGKGSQLKTNFFTGNWKTPKLVYVPDEEWESFIRKACE